MVETVALGLYLYKIQNYSRPNYEKSRLNIKQFDAFLRTKS